MFFFNTFSLVHESRMEANRVISFLTLVRLIPQILNHIYISITFTKSQLQMLDGLMFASNAPHKSAISVCSKPKLSR